ncbi:MAG: cache domain-containing protein [Amphritea sp.]
MISDSKLFRRFFLVVLLIIAVMFVAIYMYSVPLIQKEVYEIERNSARLALNNVFQLANKMHSDLEGYRQQALESHKQRLKAVVTLTEAHIREAYAEAERTNTTLEQARTRIFNGLRNFTYDNDGYVWIADHDTNLLSHPDPRFQNMDISVIGTSEQETLIRKVIHSATTEGEGFYQYKWQRLNEGPALDKLSYVKNYPQWGFVIGSGLYLDDIESEVHQRKQDTIREVREALSKIRVAKTGYLFIFDKEGQILAHPNPNIDQTNALDLMDPLTGRSIIEELIEVADTGKELHYKWDKPSDPGNYIYDKISLVRSLDGFGWYICSSVYEDELRNSSALLSERILTIALISILMGISLAIYFINRITQPIKQLARTAARVHGGDLTAKSGIVRDDEIGMLARTFDTMVKRLHNNIQTLDSKVKSRTQELAQLEERQRLILDALPAQIAYLDKDLQYIFVNQGYADFFNKSKHEIIGQPITKIIDSVMMDSINEQVSRCLAGEEVVYEYRFDLDEREIITKRTLLPDIAADGQIIGLLNLSLDITAEKEAEHKLTEAQRISAAGQLAGGLAHDFNNLLTVILGNLLAANDHFATTEGLAKYINPAIRASRRGADITGRLLAFSRRQALIPTTVNLNTLLQETVELLEGSLSDDIEVVSHNMTDTALFVDPGQLENALVNLALNAKDAMPQGGRIEFIVNVRSIGSPLSYDEEVPPGQYIEIQVNDNGCGFSPEAKKLAYEPFYTTKGIGEGSGLGLSMVYGFIKQSRGYISIESRPGQGASISLLLPVTDVPPLHADLNSPLSLSTDKNYAGKLMLLVEDDGDVRAIVREQLMTLGFTVIEAGDADEAEHLINTLKSIKGMVSDINMPGRLNGFELAALMRKKSPTNTIVLISGYEYDQLSSRDKQQHYKILRKPFDKETLEQAINNPHIPSSTQN